MKEFMLLIRNIGDNKSALSIEDHTVFLKKCEVYIGKLKAAGKLIAAQPLVREGKIISRVSGNWVETALTTSNEIQVGYYHILSDSLDQAISIAKENPEFEYSPSATIEVRPIKTKEDTTQFVYPK